MDARLVTTGNDDGLKLRLDWSEPGTAPTAAELSRAGVLLWIAGELVWGKKNGPEPSPFNWTWVELLEFLVEAWPYLVWEEGYPNGLQPPRPSLLAAAAEEEFQDQPEDISVAKESAVFAFEETHDLARGLQGVKAPSVWLVREGKLFWVSSQQRSVLRPAEEVLDQLRAIGEAVRARLAASPDPRARAAVEGWDARDNRSAAELVGIVTRLPEPLIERFAGVTGNREDWGGDAADFQMTEVLAAARMMAGSLTTQHLETAVRAIASLPRNSTPELDAVAAAARGVVDLLHPGKAFDEGYKLAAWFRAARGIGNSQAVDPNALLVTYGVLVREVDIPDDRLDALAVWGPKHGPGVVLNQGGRRAGSSGGRRFSLAHELCHLLIDREGALPLAEVFNGRAPRRIEARANAFAAEFLLPRDEAAAAVRHYTEVGEAVRELGQKYRVSHELAAWQIRNSNLSLSEEQVEQLRPLVSDPSRF
jgi:Zn-dependent peptidase ImmA (M78 family)